MNLFFFIRLSAVLAPSVIGVDTAAVKQLHLELTASSAHTTQEV